VFFVKHVASKRAWISPATFSPHGEWAAQQARNFLMHIADHGLAATHIICDRDTRYYGPFMTILRSEGIEVKRIAPSAPEMNGHSESFVGTLKRECLDHFVISSAEHMDRFASDMPSSTIPSGHTGRSTMARSSLEERPPARPPLQWKISLARRG
jgi:hypothetical protein